VKQSADFSVISVWAYNNIGQWFWCDGICKRQDMAQNLRDLFRLAQLYKPQGVGIEVTGQQEGFVQLLQEQMLDKNIHFPLTSHNNSNRPGLRPNTQKLVRFNIVVPWFKSGMIFFPLEMKTHETIAEAVNELSLASASGFRSKHDDFIDTISMLSLMNAWKPSEEAPALEREEGYWALDDEPREFSALASYIV
jgi:predicted phage terminase large subunit-like protein